MTTAIILFAHGSRDPLWRLPIEAVATEIRHRHPAALVSCAYLELCLPSLPQAADDMVSAGAVESYFPLAAQLTFEADPARAGLASLSMVLNALGVDPGRVPTGYFAGGDPLFAGVEREGEEHVHERARLELTDHG